MLRQARTRLATPRVLEAQSPALSRGGCVARSYGAISLRDVSNLGHPLCTSTMWRATRMAVVTHVVEVGARRRVRDLGTSRGRERLGLYLPRPLRALAWADNIFLFCNDNADAQQMLLDLEAALRCAGWRLKGDECGVLVSSSVA